MKAGIIGAGRIAGTMAYTMSHMPDVECYAIASRSKEKSEEFAAKYGFEKAYGSYEELMNDPQVDFIYVATPHIFHYEIIKKCLNAGHHVICEKPITINRREAEELFELAAAKNLVLTEGIWIRYQPSRDMITEILESGVIGDVTTLEASLCYRTYEDPRLVRPELAGGALLDIGVYTLNFAGMHMGSDHDSITATCSMTDTGVDSRNCIILQWQDGRYALLFTSIMGVADRRACFHGTKGYLTVDNVNNPTHLEVFNAKYELVKQYDVPEQITGFEYEVRELMQTIESGELECKSAPHDECLRILGIMDDLRRQWGIVYPTEQQQIRRINNKWTH